MKGKHRRGTKFGEKRLKVRFVCVLRGVIFRVRHRKLSKVVFTEDLVTSGTICAGAEMIISAFYSGKKNETFKRESENDVSERAIRLGFGATNRR